jgi:hypothetical protein
LSFEVRTVFQTSGVALTVARDMLIVIVECGGGRPDRDEA